MSYDNHEPTSDAMPSERDPSREIQVRYGNVLFQKSGNEVWEYLTGAL